MGSLQNASTGLKRVAAYCRVSTDREDQANSFEAQQRYFRAHIERNPDWKLQEIYADEGLSGTNTKKRKRFHSMICAAREGKIDLIVTKEVSRFARNTLDTLEYTRELRKHGVGVIFLNDNINSLDLDGEFRLTIMASVAQEESRKTSERVKWGQTRSMEQGVVFGGSLLGYDVMNGRMTINPEGAKTVRYIFHKYLNERKGAGVIAGELRKEGIVSSRGNLKWTAPTVLKILKNEKYCGDLIQKKTYTPDFLSHEKKYNRGQEAFVRLRDHHEPIVDRSTWEAVQRELARRSRNTEKGGGHGNRYPLSGKIKCASCGGSFLSRGKRSANGKLYRVWRCGKATREGKLHIDANGDAVGCDVGRQIREEAALDILRHTVKEVQIDSEVLIQNLSNLVEDVLRKEQDNGRTEERRLERELEVEKEKKRRALEAFFDCAVSEADFRFMNECIDSRIAQFNDRIAAIQKERFQNSQAKESRQDICAAVSEIVTCERASDDFYGHLLHHMTVYSDGRVEVILKHLPARWFYLYHTSGEAVQNDSSLPMSVSNPFASS